MSLLILASLGTTYVIKYTVARTRPGESEATSFPAGHTCAAFLGPTFIHRRYGWKYSVPLYFFAGFVGFSRVYADKHWVGDVSAVSIDGKPGMALQVKW